MKKYILPFVLLSIAFALSFVLANGLPAQYPTMCALKDTEIRTNPTGYILARIEEGTPVKLIDTASPFAWVEYGGILGTVTESHIGECEDG